MHLQNCLFLQLRRKIGSKVNEDARNLNAYVMRTQRRCECVNYNSICVYIFICVARIRSGAYSQLHFELFKIILIDNN